MGKHSNASKVFSLKKVLSTAKEKYESKKRSDVSNTHMSSYAMVLGLKSKSANTMYINNQQLCVL